MTPLRKHIFCFFTSRFTQCNCVCDMTFRDREPIAIEQADNESNGERKEKNNVINRCVFHSIFQFHQFCRAHIISQLSRISPGQCLSIENLISDCFCSLLSRMENTFDIIHNSIARIFTFFLLNLSKKWINIMWNVQLNANTWSRIPSLCYSLSQLSMHNSCACQILSKLCAANIE